MERWSMFSLKGATICDGCDSHPSSCDSEIAEGREAYMEDRAGAEKTTTCGYFAVEFRL
jgi:hypothetical protein